MIDEKIFERLYPVIRKKYPNYSDDEIAVLASRMVQLSVLLVRHWMRSDAKTTKLLQGGEINHDSRDPPG
jgi:hypothetical protein